MPSDAALPALPFRAIGRRRRAPKPVPVAPEAIPFQDDLHALLAEPPPPFLGGAHYLVALLFLALLALACVARVDMVVTASGRLAPDSPPIVLQPMERAVLTELRVKPGEEVKRGQVLAVLDSTFTAADIAALTTQRQTLLAQRRRLEAEMSDQPLPPPPPGDQDQLLQSVLHAQREAVRRARLRAFEEEIGSIAASLRTLEDSTGLLAEQSAIARDVETMRARLMEGQVGSRLNLLGARSQRLKADQDLSQARNRMAELRHALQAKQAERQTFLDDWQRQLLEELVRIRGELSRTEETLAKANRLAELTLVTAPQDGIVQEVARRSAGSVLREAEPLVVLVPAHVPLIAEAAVRSADIGYLRQGAEVVLKVDAFPFNRHGALHGTLLSVGQDSFARQPAAEARPDPGAAGAFHAARIGLTQTALTNLPPGARPLPGMTLSAEIKVGSRRVISYLVDPLLRGLQESIREP
ncbi:HlyD family type I secretion periplasmic adaptor subunit [Siccirubricoccus sp. KC 17139]|uniref:Membrane fusion protein (MFP) family protein n=1 Tax=Siccirubricoccus soli TaxID=2899147 RepID=A0ABT1D170_9PROT|nr:HlyD family type I secretion periplasmic adaptor subunit [Siccirubricoccus soli]MCO6415659.1 HlyD family type I secretion periplasmic adaptor subunit [Siccirubricoccus soli]MCP2681791.1 HlyD family type I secretion periplasmic adaptor subunit [Siccirubricoccus soli]